jgi:hypothetical protein
VDGTGAVQVLFFDERTKKETQLAAPRPGGIKPLSGFQTLIAVARARQLDLYLDGIPLQTATLHLPRDIAPGHVQFGVVSANKGGGHMEVQRLTIWPADGVPMLGTRPRNVAAHAWLVEIENKDMAKKPTQADLKLPALKVAQWLLEWDAVTFDEELFQSKPQPHFYLLSLPASHLKALTGVYRRSAKAGKPRAMEVETGESRPPWLQGLRRRRPAEVFELFGNLYQADVDLPQGGAARGEDEQDGEQRGQQKGNDGTGDEQEAMMQYFCAVEHC